MPDKEKSKSITTMSKIVWGAGTLAAVAGGITGFKTIKSEIVDFIHVEVHNAKADDVKRFEDAITELKDIVDSQIKSKSESFSVGLRMNTINNHLYYKAEDGNQYPAYKDIQMSNTYNYPYFYYINPVNGEKEWCK
jgi:hypothetical protein